MLRTIQITLPEELLQRVDQAADELEITRSAFTRRAYEDALQQLHLQQLEEEDAAGYARQPSDLSEVTPWEALQDWGDA